LLALGFSFVFSIASSEKYASKEVFMRVPGGLAGLPAYRMEPLNIHIYVFVNIVVCGIYLRVEGHL
jgi:hypothetical protein